MVTDAGPGTGGTETSGAVPHTLALGARILARNGLLTMLGTVSTEGPRPGRYLLCAWDDGDERPAGEDRGRGWRVHELGVEDEWRAGLPAELYLHAEAHRAARVAALVCTHAPALTELSAGDPPSEMLHLHNGFWPEPLPAAESPELAGDRTAARALLDTLGDSALALVRWNGAVIAGASLREVVIRAILAEEHARLAIGVRSSHRPVTPFPGDRRELDVRMGDERFLTIYWDYEASFVSSC